MKKLKNDIVTDNELSIIVQIMFRVWLSISVINHKRWKVSRWNVRAVFPRTKFIIYDGGRIIWFFILTEIKSYDVYGWPYGQNAFKVARGFTIKENIAETSITYILINCFMIEILASVNRKIEI